MSDNYDCRDEDDTPYPEHDWGSGAIECRRCGTELDTE